MFSIFVGKFGMVTEDWGRKNWIVASGSETLSNTDLYVTAMYATITFIVTVGYGDILAINYVERILASVMMYVGVIGFSFLQGQFVSIITSYDEVCADHLYQMNLLKEIQDKYNVGHDMFYDMVRSLKYSRVKKSQRIQ